MSAAEVFKVFQLDRLTGSIRESLIMFFHDDCCVGVRLDQIHPLHVHIQGVSCVNASPRSNNEANCDGMQRKAQRNKMTLNE